VTLDFAKATAQKQSQVTFASTSFYAEWRSRQRTAVSLRDSSDLPPERLLQAIWQHQRLQRTALKTLDGQIVRVLHPGFSNLEGGPDFRDAVIQIGNEPAASGDVEIDLRSNGWRAHGHDKNPAFNKVILHVVWNAEQSAGPPTLTLQQALDSPLAELSLQLDHVSIRTLPENFRGRCSSPLRDLPEAVVAELLREAAQVRMENKAALFRVRAQQVGWEQALWEGLFRALGYKHNVWPMQHLAEGRPRWLRQNDSLLGLQARLFGLSGLLPAELNRKGGDGYLRQIWDLWWRERDEFTDLCLPRNLWRFHGLRPANHPQRRLGLASHWLHAGKLCDRIERWCGDAIPDQKLLGSLLKCFQVTKDDYWSWHWTFRSARLKKAQPLLGEGRVTDLAVNVVLPWLWARARTGKNETVRAAIEHRFAVWPAAADNSVLRLARQRLLGRSSSNTAVLKSAAAQQGLMQIVRDFCDHSNAACDGCSFPELVRQRSVERSPAPSATSQKI
jgi:hypothetical protein